MKSAAAPLSFLATPAARLRAFNVLTAGACKDATGCWNSENRGMADALRKAGFMTGSRDKSFTNQAGRELLASL